MAEVVVKKQKKSKKVVPNAKLFVLATPNNTKITVTDLEGNVLCWSNCGVAGFKGSKKSTAYAATKAAEDVAVKAQKYGVQEVHAYIKGFSQGRSAVLRGIRAVGIKIGMLTDMTPVPHGGVKIKKLRKV